MKNQGINIYALEITSGAKKISEFNFKEPFALVIGNEVSGISDDVLSLCADTVMIPMSGVKESLNVSVAFGIALYAAQNNYLHR